MPTDEVFFPLNGLQPANFKSLQLSDSQSLIQVVSKSLAPAARILEAYHSEDGELLVLEIEPEIPQHPVYDIRPVERIAVHFKNNAEPITMALRRDFPVVPHSYFGSGEVPSVLCLSDIPYAEQQRSFTIAGLLKQIHRWLTLTARGELHADDQPLEPFFFSSKDRIIVPYNFFEDEPDEYADLVLYRSVGTMGNPTLIATPRHNRPEEMGAVENHFVPLVFTLLPQHHGVIRNQPRTLADLHRQLAHTGFDVANELRAWVRACEDSVLGNSLFLFIRIPKTRTPGGKVEAVEVWAFPTLSTVTDIGEALGIWLRHNGSLARLLEPDLTRTGEEIKLDVLVPVPSLTRHQAARLNGLPEPIDLQFMAVGAGALGSQVINNLIRAGVGTWRWLDDDLLLPHNLTRHFLTGPFLGSSKVEAMAALLNTTYESPVITPVAEDAIAWVDDPENTKIHQFDIVLDLSASVAVARQLALSNGLIGRRISLFLSPSGDDLVLLAEPLDRSLRLDLLEMEYYAALTRDPALHHHLLKSGQPIRYAHACRDVSSQIPQDRVALLSAVASHAVKSVIQESDPSIKIWHSSEDFGLSVKEIPFSTYDSLIAGEWTIWISKRVVSSINEQRLAELPNETGGVLVGAFDTVCRYIYIVEQIASPPDSQEWPTAYIRGTEGLKENLSSVGIHTANQLQYIGEWHSHPVGVAALPSEDDLTLFTWLSEHRQADGFPAVMVIVGDDEIGIIVENPSFRAALQFSDSVSLEEGIRDGQQWN